MRRTRKFFEIQLIFTAFGELFQQSGKKLGDMSTVYTVLKYISYTVTSRMQHTGYMHAHASKVKFPKKNL